MMRNLDKGVFSVKDYEEYLSTLTNLGDSHERLSTAEELRAMRRPDGAEK
ncbi:MAG: hypothetical protein PHU25_10810 [Deltaproteobacteria bacterium]|nr:hypothetical protein [Deltaproteobacteria bacterium]